jgi:hypothetical protein
MLFAQTGTTNTLSNPSAVEEVNPYMIALWWLIPLAIAAVWIALTVRSNQAKERRKKAINQSETTKSKDQRRAPLTSQSSASMDTTLPMQDKPNSTPSSTSSSTGQKKSKKDKSKVKTAAEPTDRESIQTNETAVSTVPNTLEANVAAISPALSATQPNTETKPSSAIFEPLRDAARSRRKSYPDDNSESRDSRGDSSLRDNDAYNQLFGGKFERIIPKQSLRSVASRWPVSESPLKTQTPAVTRAQPTVQNVLPVAETLESPKMPEPVKGLKSFVSKVKSLPESDLPPDKPSDDLQP